SSVVWLTVTFLTQPVNQKTLENFYSKVHPGGVLWKPIAEKVNIKGDRGLIWDLIDWVVGIILIYATLFGVGKILLAQYLIGFTLLLVALIAFGFIMWELKRRGWEALKVE
ncbi:MAG: sodium:proline symporter, partial [bacterium]